MGGCQWDRAGIAERSAKALCQVDDDDEDGARNMKKLFSKIDNTSKEPNSYLGKVFVVGSHTVTVEEVLAEGIYDTTRHDYRLINIRVIFSSRSASLFRS